MTQPEPAEKQWQTILALILSALGIVLSLTEALSAIALGLFSAGLDFIDNLTTIPVGFLVWSFVLSIVLLLPVLLLSIYRLLGKPAPKWLDLSRPAVGKAALFIILAWPVMAFLGWWIAGFSGAAEYLLGLVNILVTGIPVLWIYTLSQWKLSAGTQTRKWRIFGFSFMVMPSAIIFVEMLALLGVAVVVGLIFIILNSIDPTLIREIKFVIAKVSLAHDMDSVIVLLKPYLLRPTIIFLILSIFSGLIPLIEEVLKPAALWALAGKKLTPRDGFVGGLICGAAFALMENILFFSSVMSADEWLIGAIARSTTGVLHMLGSGLVGWGLAKVWQDGKWFVLGRNLLLAITFHGLWNALAVFAGIAPLLVYGVDATFWQNLLFYVPLILVLILAFIALMLLNRRFRKQQNDIAADLTVIEENQA